MQKMRVMVESPYGDDIARNIEYARKAMMDSVARGEAPFLSHLLYTQGLGGWADEKEGKSDPSHWISREDGIQCAEAWRQVSVMTVFYIDYGMSSGMQEAEKLALKYGWRIEYRKILLL